MTGEQAIELEHVTFSYNGGRPVLEDVSLRIPRGGITSIVGPNGGGKTTLLKLCLGLLKPDQGQVHVLGRPPEQARQQVGYVPQQVAFDPLFPATALDVVLMGRLTRGRMFGLLGARDRELALEALREVDLDRVSSRPFSELSGGQQQRVLIARALATQPELLLLDEPVANVDQQTQQELHQLMHQLEQRLTVVLVTHDMHFVTSCVEEVICVNRQVAVHPTSELPEGPVGGIGHHHPDLRMVQHGQRIRQDTENKEQEGTRGRGC